MIVRTTKKENEYYVNIKDLIDHYQTSQESVTAWCEDAAPLGTKIVVDTLQTSIDFLNCIIKIEQVRDETT